MMTTNPKICPDCGLPYTAGHACVTLTLKLTVDDSNGDIFVQQIFDADYDIQSQSFKPVHLGKKVKVKVRSFCPHCDNTGYVERSGQRLQCLHCGNFGNAE